MSFPIDNILLSLRWHYIRDPRACISSIDMYPADDIVEKPESQLSITFLWIWKSIEY